MAAAPATNQDLETRYIKAIEPVCSKELSIWPHEQAILKLRWVPYRHWSSGQGPNYGEECYDIQVQRVGKDVE